MFSVINKRIINEQSDFQTHRFNIVSYFIYDIPSKVCNLDTIVEQWDCDVEKEVRVRMILNITKSNESHKLTDKKLLQQVHEDPQVAKSVKPNSASPQVEPLPV